MTAGRLGLLRLALAVPLVAACAPLVAACVPAPVTNEGRAIADLYGWFMVGAVGVAGLVFVLATFAILRYRTRRRDGPHDDLPEQRHGSLRLEATWTVIPVALVLALFAGTLAVLAVVERQTPAPTEVRVEAHRWGWSFSFPAAGVRVSGTGEPGPEVVLPVNQPVRVVLSAADVIHAFYVPEFLFKRDAVPGRQTTFEFTIAEAGTYRGQCAEFCGILHARMPFTVRAVSAEEFEAWLAGARAVGPSSAPTASPG